MTTHARKPTRTTIHATVHALRAVAASLMLATCAHAIEIEAGPIHTEIDARTRCPAICEAARGLKWDGKWRVVSDTSALCSCLPTVNPAAPPVIRYEQTDFRGGDLPNGRAPAPSFALCGDQCLADARCVAYTWSPVDAMCSRKDGSAVRMPGQGTSGYLSERGVTPPPGAASAPSQAPAQAPVKKRTR